MLAFDQLLPIAVAASTLVSLLLLLQPAAHRGTEERSGHHARRYQVVVLGDIGRSPRMQYHALSIAKHGGLVDLIGYHQSDLHPDISSNASIIVHALTPVPTFLQTKSRWVFLLLGPLKVLFQISTLWVVLGYKTHPAQWLLVQNPPSIPTLFVAQIICFLRNTRLIIDWHNFGYSILALKLGSHHPLVRILQLYEKVFSGLAVFHFTVSEAMNRSLKQNYNIKTPIITLHDRPFVQFQPLDRTGRSAFLRRLHETEPFVNEIEDESMRLLVGSTSWTVDEDFSFLLDALVEYSRLAMHAHPQLPRILVIITGKGPLKMDFLKKVSVLEAKDELELVAVKTAWLSFDDYANLLGAADLGISLHMSSSGVDLPMKVVDMFGAGLPVVGWGEFEAWSELVVEGVNGRSFRSTTTLLNILIELLGGDKSRLQNLKDGALKESRHRWDQEWDPRAGRLLELC